jgi:hypothetical protein
MQCASSFVQGADNKQAQTGPMLTWRQFRRRFRDRKLGLTGTHEKYPNRKRGKIRKHGSTFRPGHPGQPFLAPLLPQGSAQKKRSAAGFHADQFHLQVGGKVQELRSRETRFGGTSVLQSPAECVRASSRNPGYNWHLAWPAPKAAAND